MNIGRTIDNTPDIDQPDLEGIVIKFVPVFGIIFCKPLIMFIRAQKRRRNYLVLGKIV
jgi:hypothetical protein